MLGKIKAQDWQAAVTKWCVMFCVQQKSAQIEMKMFYWSSKKKMNNNDNNNRCKN